MIGRPVVRMLMGDHDSHQIGEVVQGCRERSGIDQKGLLVRIETEGGMFELGDAHGMSQLLQVAHGKRNRCATPGIRLRAAPIWRSENRRGILERLSRDGNVSPDGPIV